MPAKERHAIIATTMMGVGKARHAGCPSMYWCDVRP